MQWHPVGTESLDDLIQDRMLRELDAASADFVHLGLIPDDTDLDVVLMVGVGDSDAWVDVLRGSPTLFVALEMLQEPPADALLAVHELVHVAHMRALWPRFATEPELRDHHADVSLAKDIPTPYPEEWVRLLERGEPGAWGCFPAGHFHTGEELAQELTDAGLIDVEVHAVEGSAGLALGQVLGTDPDLVEAALTIVRRTGSIPGIRDVTNHMMGIARLAGP